VSGSKNMKLIISLDDFHDIPSLQHSPVVREILQHAQQIIQSGGQFIIQQEFANAPPAIVTIISTSQQLEEWLA